MVSWTHLFLNSGPPPPTDLRDMSVEREPRLIQVSWKSPGTSKGVLKYQVSVNGSDVSPINTTDTQAALDGLLPDGTYSVGVQSFLVGPDGNAVFSKTLKGTFHTGMLVQFLGFVWKAVSQLSRNIE